MDYGAYGNSRDRTAMDFHNLMDHKWSLVAIHCLGLCSSAMGNRCFNLLLQTCCLYLSRVSRNIQTSFQGNVLGVPYTQNAPSDLSQVWA